MRTVVSTAFRSRCRAALLLTLPLSLFADLLVTRTHHRPLGAATFASLALVAFVLVWLTLGVLLAPGAPAAAKPAPAAKPDGAPVEETVAAPQRSWPSRLTWAASFALFALAIARLLG